MLTVGIDPGLSGAIGVLARENAFVAAIDLPVVADHSLAWIDASALLVSLRDILQGRPARAIVERVSAMPGQGVSSTFKFGSALGSLLATLQVYGLPIEFVTPSKWKAGLGLGREKLAALHRARLLFPAAPLDRVKDHGRAEALLIAYWRQQYAVSPDTVVKL